MDYDLTRLGSREFEHLTQAFAVKLGPAVRVFGDGPDGGREAAFTGRIDTPSGAQGEPVWDGRGVVQAKFRTRLYGTASDSGWFLTQLQHELARWADDKSERVRKIGRPDFILVTTNVTLSPTPEGGIDKVDEVLRAYANRYGLKGWAIWHYDQFRALLDADTDIRTSYAALITPGDVLFRIHEVLVGTPADLGDRLAVHAAKELLSDQWLRLGQAGSATGEKLSLSDVAIDLQSDLGSPPDTRPVLTAAHALSHGELRLPDQARHLVIVGGPGQGKTTLGQLICQMYRVAMLGDGSDLGDEVRGVLSAWRMRLAHLNLPVPAKRRWPIRIDLATYADAIAGGEDVSLLRFIAERVGRRSPSPVTAADLAAWLGAWPWLIVLDGLDEVAAPSVREGLLTQISDFRIDAARARADVLLVVTTRPQGYAGELGDGYGYLALRPLEAEEAIAYAEVLGEMRHGNDPDFRDEVLKRVRAAAKEESTGRLMRSPLQVTIMSLLLERMHRAPQSRYALFSAYYDTIYAREVGKGGPTSRLLEEGRGHIDHLHEQVAVQLQQQAEARGAADVQMPGPELHALVVDRLNTEQHDPANAISLADRLVRVATHRLVLLIPKTLDHVGFEVRSLQEFLAAKAITSGPEPRILDRLRVLLPSAHWRNTWLFGVGRLFVEREHVRADIIGMLAEADTATQLSLHARPGTDAAFDLLDDDVAVASPAFQRQLVERAAHAFFTPPPRGLGDVARILLLATRNDVVARSILISTAEAALADGATRTYTALVLHAWTDHGQPLGTSADQLLARQNVLPRTFNAVEAAYHHLAIGFENASVTFGTDSPVRRMIGLSAFLRESHLFGSSGDQNDPALNAVLEHFGLVVLGERDGLPLFLVSLRFPAAQVMTEAVTHPTVAEEYAALISALTLEQPVVAAVLRRFAQYGMTRVEVSDRLRPLFTSSE